MERKSSIKIYYIITAFVVVVFHFKGWLVGGMPNKFDLEHISVYKLPQARIEPFSRICEILFFVNSGCLGIRLKWQWVVGYVACSFVIFLMYVMDVYYIINYHDYPCLFTFGVMG